MGAFAASCFATDLAIALAVVNFVCCGLAGSGFGTGDGSLGGITGWQLHERNGTCKYTGEAGDDGLTELYPNFYDSGDYDSLNSASHYVEYAADIPLGQQSGVYRGTLYYHLRTQTH